ncbi:uncharacterized protein LOC110457616 [Mizuhopecten yessoensis]|uniref:Uncharacterized protein n=1 Tax=Mizuhopecten yessoensis TaxID=6573 RepID=A0A210Q8F1_MIZYE|nr:uncharacterized protein LOC110457616 [Mizuhopecten yessoensis]XP_021364645.1 uncharacterized protein LOC110457616 [Mizuhopecten yessoensis]XP_021364646.1 uncharacterized protein LOC110457616 [Mizuhopecten yessoensis]XP_021364647.1 uncharacterized protein LOC110457616 [Mizuhopecten yessoensis]OWF45013.1 hypothetical protein KP79_PYT07823 [Mizuhopecten yessoensis]
MEKNITRTPSFQEASDLLKVHLQKKHRLKRHSPCPPQPPTKQEVRNEAAMILEQFLLKELKENKGKHGKPLIGTAYQQVKDVDVTEEEYYLHNSYHSHQGAPLSPDSSSDRHHQFGTSGHAGHTSVIHSRGHSELSHASLTSGKTSSVIHSRETSEISRTSINSAKTSIHSLLDENNDIPFADDHVTVPRAKSLPPDLSPAHRIDNNIMTTSYSLSPSKLENLDKNKDIVDLKKKGRDRASRPVNGNSSSTVITRGRQRYKSGSISSSDTESDAISQDRKKKSVFKRAKERLNSVLNRSKDRKTEDREGDFVTKKGNHGQNKRSGAKVLEEKHTHKHGHVEQHHYTDGDRTGLVRSQEMWESTDITDQEHNKHKHIDKHCKMKESADLSSSAKISEGGIFSSLRKLTSRRGKKSRKKVPGSKSADFSMLKKKKKKKAYSRNISVPDGPLRDWDNSHFESTSFEVDGRRTKHTTHVTSIDDVGLNAISNLDIGQGSEPMDVEDGGLPTNQSFAYDYDIDETEFRRRLLTGEIDIERNIYQHHTDTLVDDLDVDGNTHPDDEDERPQSSAGAVGSPEGGEDPTQEDKEKLYGIIAERLAEMGDSYMAGASGEAHAASPRRTSSSAQASLEASYDVRDGDGLNSLERELRDSLRNFGDNFSVEHPVSAEVTEAAVDIVRQATYNTFTDTLKRAIGDEVGWDQLATLFYITKKTVKAAGVGGAVALKVKEMSLRYLEDKFAGWIVDQGGWDTVLESESTDSELD